jgi:uncharacterized protein YggU (UPF0235/DUF167 family)
MKISVTVHPNSKKPRIVKNDSDNLDVYVAQKAVDNQANLATIAALAKYFQVKKSAVNLVLGQKSKLKVYSIE